MAEYLVTKQDVVNYVKKEEGSMFCTNYFIKDSNLYDLRCQQVPTKTFAHRRDNDLPHRASDPFLYDYEKIICQFSI